MSHRPLPVLAALALLGACTTPGADHDAAWTVPLAPGPAAYGGLARATLLPSPTGTRIEVFFTAAGPQPTIPLHVYTYLYEGRCAQLPAASAYDLNDRVLVRTANGDIAQSRRGPFTLSHHVDLPLAALAGGRYALALRAAPADGGELLYCGDLQRV